MDNKSNSPLEKVLALQNLIKTQPESLNGGSARLKDLNAESLVTKFFSKAPTEFLEQKSFDELKQILKDCAGCLDKFYTQNKKPYVNAFPLGKNQQAIISVIGDRPFIVNSITECIRSLGFKIDILLHPVFILDDYRVSIIYAEIDGLSTDQVSNLIRLIENSLQDLLLATDDFTAMLVHGEKLANNLDENKADSSFSKNERLEVADFIRWLTDGGFVFLGYSEWLPYSKGKSTVIDDPKLGIFKSSNIYLSSLLKEVESDCTYALDTQNLIYVSKLNIESLVHRRVRLNHITILEPEAGGKIKRIHSILGIFTSKAISQESSSIPLIRRKLQKLIELEELTFNSHDYKYLIDVIDRMPKDLALRLDIDSLREIGRTVINLQNRHETKVSLRFDASKRGATVLIVMPRERFNSTVRAKIQEYIESEFSVASGTTDYHLDLGNKPLARFYFYIPTNNFDLLKYDVSKLEDRINELSRTWDENLEEKIQLVGQFENPNEIWNKYSQAFPEEYQATQTAEDALADLIAIQSLSEENSIVIRFNNTLSNHLETDCLTFYYSGNPISISKAFPILENAGLEVINENTYAITPFAGTPIYIQRFFVSPKNNIKIDSLLAEKYLTPGLESIFKEQAENDWLNALLVSAQLDMGAISVLRAYSSLMWQVTNYATKRTISESFSETPRAAALFWKMFEARFDPDLQISIQERTEKFDSLFNQYIDELRKVKDINRDRILRGFANLVQHTLRTNFYQGKPYISIKIESEHVEIMPQPRPKFEIFMYAPHVEGVHLRAANIARGGIRWSDRNDDFRSEVLGLVKTQKIKNAVIVPNGSKGGFVLRQMPKAGEPLQPYVENAYKDFIRSLLSITDNLIDGQPKPPERVICHDPSDPYLVVAADKGTATFSNLANKVAVEEFNFWLGDAFASGGSKGYDHKKYGITARGAWESVKRHFKDLQIDYINEPFTVIGIGDMAGDVFGNGLLYSDKIKLISAFNHKHIFIDPNPDPAKSFKERKRLFEMPRSQWTDYNKDLISEGGAIFERFDKEIQLSSQARAALGVPNDCPQILSGEYLISFILRAPVDLLWNGGIGTYVKSSSETHAEVNDGTNDRVRINANDLRAKIVAEGGNLGFTQKARIECAEEGIRVNTDAIDNSAGVDLSDHEVNIKILCAQLIKDKVINAEERDKLLLDVDDEVVKHVLSHNKSHATLLSIGIRRSFKSLEYYSSLSRLLNSLGYINRHLEVLPDEEEFTDRLLKRKGLVSPEISIFLAGVKMWVKDELLGSKLCKDPRLSRFLLDYFPDLFKKKFASQIINHPLAANIIASQVANNLIDIVGITFVHRMCITHSTKPIVVLKCLLAAEFILQTRQIRQSLSSLDTIENNDTYLQLLQSMGKVLRDASSWLISYHGDNLDLSQIVDLYEQPYQILAEKGAQLFSGTRGDKYAVKLNEYENTLKIDSVIARKLALAPNIIAALEMLWASKKSKSDILLVASVFSEISDVLNLQVVLSTRESIETPTKWEHQLLLNSFEEIRRSVSLITCRMIELGVTDKGSIKERLVASPSFTELTTTLGELQNSPINVAALSVVAKQLRTFTIQ